MRVAVVGRSWRTALGTTIDAAVDRLVAGAAPPRIRPVELLGKEGPMLGAEVDADPTAARPSKLVGRLGLLTLDCAREATSPLSLPAAERLGLFAATSGLRVRWRDTLAALVGQQPDGFGAWQRGLGRLHPFWLLRHLSNVTHAEIAIELGARGEGATFGGWNAGAQALVAAAAALEARAVDAAVVVAHDSLLDPEALVERRGLVPAHREPRPERGLPEPPRGRRAIEPRASTDPHAERGTPERHGERALRGPYGRSSVGWWAAEASAALVLVRPSDADRTPCFFVWATEAARGASAGSDADLLRHGLRRLFRVAFREESRSDGADGGTGASPPPLRELVVDGAAIGDRDVDDAERAVIGQWVSPSSPLIALQSRFGQLGAVAPLVQAIALGELLRRGELPAIASLPDAAAGPLRPVQSVERTTLRRAVGLSLTPGHSVGLVAVEVA